MVRVKHRDQVGYFGIYKDGDLKYPFAFQFLEPQSYDEGIGNSMTKSTTPESALRSLIHYMTEMQRKTDEQQINPEARKGLAQWTLQEFLETLPDSLDRQKVHRPPRPHRHGTANGGGRGPNIHILKSAGQIVRSASHVVLDPAK